MLTTSRDRRFYLTVRDPQRKQSKTVTIRGDKLTAEQIIRLVVRAVRESRKAG
ncbi:MAG: hypothetical protein J5J06_05500 [Phycisphaerae bacterium]|nr:hypothetical protein [Phycisphaerae bacterium]